MSKKNKSSGSDKNVEKTSDYYKLKTKAVKDLVEADESNSPPVSDEELKKYRSGLKLKIPDIVKVCFIKWWFAGCMCFFFFWGLGNYVSDMLDMIFITGIGLGICTDLLTNNVLRYFEPYPNAWAKWVNFYRKRYATFFFNILYSYGVLLLVFLTYGLINLIVMRIRGLTELSAYVAVEPILFGLLYLGFDMLLLKMRNTFRNIVSDARKPGI